MDLAKDIHRDKLRSARESVMKQLDVDFMRAVEQNDTEEIQRIAQKKQELRDMTKNPLIENAKSADQLKAFWPEILNS